VEKRWFLPVAGGMEKGEYFPSINIAMRKREIFGVFGARRSDFCRLVLEGFSGLVCADGTVRFEGGAGRREGVFCEAEAKGRRRCDWWDEGRWAGRVDELDDEFW
jgi:hypothetical protein